MTLHPIPLDLTVLPQWQPSVVSTLFLVADRISVNGRDGRGTGKGQDSLLLANLVTATLGPSDKVEIDFSVDGGTI